MLSDEAIRDQIPFSVSDVELHGYGARLQGKVRDFFDHGDERVLITTDRVSAFDKVIGTIPHKGQILNQLSAWWFGQLADISPHHLIDRPDPNVSVVKRADALPVEVVVRGYITGVTSTSLWMLYERGVERPYGLKLPKGLKKNDALPEPVITPTTKSPRGKHDERLTSAEVVQRGFVEPSLWEHVCRIAVALYRRGARTAEAKGLILVDTKYEFGLLDSGDVVLIDEVHTPDSSRYWRADSYKPGATKAPFAYDKEVLREWLADQGFRGKGAPPRIPPDIAATVAKRYIELYEMLTGEEFQPGRGPADKRIQSTLDAYFANR